MKSCAKCHFADTVPLLNPIQIYLTTENTIGFFHKLCALERKLCPPPKLDNQSQVLQSKSVYVPLITRLDKVEEAKRSGVVSPKDIFGPELNNSDSESLLTRQNS